MLKTAWRLLPDRWLPAATLRTYLAAVVLVATLPIALVLIWQTAEDITEARQRQRSLLQDSAAQVSHDVGRALAESMDELTGMGLSPALQTGDLLKFEELLQQLRPMRQRWNSFFLLDRNGHVLVDTAGLAIGATPEPVASALARKVLAQGKPEISGVSRVGGGHAGMVVITPVGTDGSAAYVLGGRMDLAYWQQLLESSTPPEGVSLSLRDGADQRLAGTTRANPALPVPAPDDNAAPTVETASNARYSTLDEPGFLRAELPVAAAGWTASAATTTLLLEQTERSVVLSALATTGICLLLATTLALLLAWRITSPLKMLALFGPTPLPRHMPVLEIGLLRDALLQARLRDAATRQQLQARVDDFETLFNSSPIGLAYSRDAGCREVTRNAAMDALFSGPVPMQPPVDVEVLFQGMRLEPGQQPLQRACLQGETIHAMEMEVRVEGRPPAFVIASAVPLLDAGGLPRGGITAIADITDVKHMGAQLAEAEQKLRAKQRLIDLAQYAGQVGFFEFRYRVDEMAWSPGQSVLFGQPPLSFTGRWQDWLARMDLADRGELRQRIGGMLARQEQQATLEYRVSGDTGLMPRWLSSRVVVRYGSDGRPEQMTGVTVDATEQKQVEHQRLSDSRRDHAARMEAEAASRAKDEFLNMLSHELRNPLGAITAAVEVISSRVGGQPMADKALAIIARQSQHLAHMMGELLDVSRMVTGKLVLASVPVDLAALLRRMGATLELTRPNGAHALHIEAQDVWVMADPVRIEAMVDNLLSNAFKYTPAGAGIHLSAHQQDGQAVLRVRDNGPGIAPELLPRIFDLFVQGERKPDRREGGLGVGLTLVRRLAELHGGTATAESSALGSCFTVTLPAIAKPSGADMLPTPSRDPSGAPESALRIVLLEDNQDVQQALRAMLETRGHRVLAADDGPAGLALLLSDGPDVAIVDIGLPGFDGMEVARRAREAAFEGRMIALSGYGNQQTAQRAREAGFDAYLVKPVEPDVLRACLQSGN